MTPNKAEFKGTNHYGKKSYCTSCGWVKKCLFCPYCGNRTRNTRRKHTPYPKYIKVKDRPTW